MSNRNVFENNDPVPSEEDAKAVGDGPHIMLPPLAEGHHYGLQKLPSGRSAVVVEEDEQQDVSEVYAPNRDPFGRHQL
jgi:hypothetical protein